MVGVITGLDSSNSTMPTTSKPHCETGGGFCPTCNQPFVTDGSDATSVETPLVNKRPHHGYVKGRSSQRKKLRSATSRGHKRVWDSTPNLPVYIKVDDGHGAKGWAPGIVGKVIDHDDGTYHITVLVKDDVSGEWVLPRTIHSHNYDAIPSVNPNDENYKLSNYITTRDESLDGLPEALIKQYRCIKYHSTGVFDAEDIPELDVIGDTLLQDDGTPSSMYNLIYSLMKDGNVKKVVKEATGEETCSAQYALAYFIGQLCGIEINDSASSKDVIDPKCLLDQIGSNDDNIQCPMSNVFLVSAMSTRARKEKEFDPNASLYDSRGRNVFSDPD